MPIDLKKKVSRVEVAAKGEKKTLKRKIWFNYPCHRVYLVGFGYM